MADATTAPQAVAPNQALYVTNLNIQINKDEMKRSLYTLFTAYGRIVDVVHQRSAGMRNKAFIIFRETSSATMALRGLNGFVFYDRPLAVYYANKRSKTIAMLEGDYAALGTEGGLGMAPDAREGSESDEDEAMDESDE